ncbi:MAG: serine hydroxymethyltransferase [Gammaproteobacteria bacterium]|nr:serine hydroxymethyltransferase [Gammaproteobacteria bacterium]MYC24332.1 serine hydroxymethyltransferase [Gammaproteobacteria bacterium]
MLCHEKLRDSDPEIWEAITAEDRRQESHIELSASENYVSPAVLEAQGCGMTNKYAEGYPGKRYYGGCDFVDQVELLAIDRAKRLFGADYANVQPHSGSQANASVYLALLEPNDLILGMSSTQGGHTTHGSPDNFSGRIYNAIHYGVNQDDGLVDYDDAFSKAQKHKPKIVVAGFSAYSRTLDWDKFREIADSVDAYLMIDMSHVAGLVAAGVYPNPIPHADVVTTTTHKTLAGPRGGLILTRANSEVEKKLNSALFPGTQGGPLMHVIAAKAVCFKEAATREFQEYQLQVVENARAMALRFKDRGYTVISGGTDIHMFLVNLTDNEVPGVAVFEALSRAKISVNKISGQKNPQSPRESHRLRIGSAAVTRRGFGTQECSTLADWMCDILDDFANEDTVASVGQRVLELCERFPVYSR